MITLAQFKEKFNVSSIDLGYSESKKRYFAKNDSLPLVSVVGFKLEGPMNIVPTTLDSGEVIYVMTNKTGVETVATI